MAFYYYGSRKSIARHYPAPIHDTIIEPFAGSAAYSLHGDNWQKNIILCDLDDRVAAVWQYLLQASAADILALPNLVEGQSLDDFQLSQAERWLIGFALRPGSGPRKTAGKCNRWPANRRYLALVVPRIKHWQFIHGDYHSLDTLLPGIKCSWFLDPPFQVGGQFYKHHAINYEELAEWAKARRGQVIVCENGTADWLPFSPLGQGVAVNSGLNGRKRRPELVWHKA